ncbi:hypothetical protein NLC26_00445 [Candidatus Aminicenantes bacterium AC-708-M15]|nr:hypothetical protein [SCandidatus Aminicenantes bacterium Aminicenantia_JdfR_composite]MCP2596665.1 hypothetical protein [Candidatus Aminicenantes bacterium AC-335-G13]MCP2603931.1 hypothetical protein [Candidatus Aminicenantes bacterium AC-708-M15]
MLIRKKILIFNLLFLLLTVFLFSQELEITYPKGGERFSNGDRIKIYWSTVGLSGNLKIYLHNLNLNTDYLIASNVPASQGYYDWTVGEYLNFRKNGVCNYNQIKITYGENKYALSGKFLIKCEFILFESKIKSPKENEIWHFGERKKIEWEPAKLIGVKEQLDLIDKEFVYSNMKTHIYILDELDQDVGDIVYNIPYKNFSYEWIVGELIGNRKLTVDKMKKLKLCISNVLKIIDRDGDKITVSGSTYKNFYIDEKALPDLYIKDLWIDVKNGKFGISYANKNQDKARVEKPYSVALFIDGKYITGISNETNQGGSHEFHYLPKLAPGKYALMGFVDSKNTIVESDENNNKKTIYFEVERKLPDLIVEKVWQEPNPAILSNWVTFKASILNKGEGPAEAFEVSQTLGGATTKEKTTIINGLKPNERKTVSFRWQLPFHIGTAVQYTCFVDKSKKIKELSENNNYKSLILKWKSSFKKVETHKKIALRAYNGKYVCADKGLNGKMIANRTAIGPWETFELIPQGGNKYALKTSYGKYVCADLGLGGKLYANRDRIGPWETFEIIELGGEKIALKASNGKYVCADRGLGDILIANRDNIGEWETFYRIYK